MTDPVETQVLVVGGGPVGLTLAMDLARRGIRTVVAELRHKGEPPSVKCNHVSARSMEIFRRLGVSKAIREAGLPADYPNDVSYRVSFAGKELSRIPIPCRRDRYTASGGPDTWWPTAEPPHRINQIYLEPTLSAHAETIAGLTLLNRVEINSFEQTPEGVTAQGTQLETIGRSRYAPTSSSDAMADDRPIRRAIGATLSGTAEVQRVQSTYIRAPSLLAMSDLKPSWATFSLNPVRSGNVYAIDSTADVDGERVLVLLAAGVDAIVREARIWRSRARTARCRPSRAGGRSPWSGRPGRGAVLRAPCRARHSAARAARSAPALPRSGRGSRVRRMSSRGRQTTRGARARASVRGVDALGVGPHLHPRLGVPGEHAGTRTRAPSSSTTQTRHTFAGWSVSP